MTGFNGGFQQNSAFNQIANMPQQQPQQPQQPQGDKFAPSNIFAAMKKNDFGKPEEQQPQGAGKYDALRPLATGTSILLVVQSLLTDRIQWWTWWNAASANWIWDDAPDDGI
jgi:hypothetical protein